MLVHKICSKETSSIKCKLLFFFFFCTNKACISWKWNYCPLLKIYYCQGIPNCWWKGGIAFILKVCFQSWYSEKSGMSMILTIINKDCVVREIVLVRFWVCFLNLEPVWCLFLITWSIYCWFMILCSERRRSSIMLTKPVRTQLGHSVILISNCGRQAARIRRCIMVLWNIVLDNSPITFGYYCLLRYVTFVSLLMQTSYRCVEIQYL